ncbi:MAG: hypothetical protein CVU05_01640 [Bacteroidetes bacterium HGW-Bacteroidetes-21]|nr:MAG: hypothetical protein CVU05_01640 [Bacteroidetes bacterium HGW-Bacteroidetes-21]
MKKALLILSAVIMTTIVISCGGMASGDFSVKYTDEAGKDVSFGSSNLGYSYSMGIYMNTFGGSPQKVVQFKMQDGSDITVDGMAGKVMDVMIWESTESIVWNTAEFDPAKTFPVTIESVTFFKDGMMDDKVYKVVGKFNTDQFKNGELTLQVNI